MIDVEVGAGAVEAVDVEKNEVRIEVDGWQPAPDGPQLDRRVDRVVAGRARGLRFRDAAVAVESTVLRGCPYTVALDEVRFVDFLTNVNVPVVYDDRLHRSTALAKRLRPERPAELPENV